MSGTMNPNLAAFGAAAQRPVGEPGSISIGAPGATGMPSSSPAPGTVGAPIGNPAPVAQPSPQALFASAPVGATGLLGLPMSFWQGWANRMQGNLTPQPQMLAGKMYSVPAANAAQSVGGIAATPAPATAPAPAPVTTGTTTSV